MSDVTEPGRVFRVVDRDGHYMCVSARLVKQCGSWWHVAYKDHDGDEYVRTHNGGRLGPLRRMHKTVLGAWLGEMWALSVEISAASLFPRAKQKVISCLGRCAEAMWHDAIEWGRLAGQLNVGGEAGEGGD